MSAAVEDPIKSERSIHSKWANGGRDAYFTVASQASLVVDWTLEALDTIPALWVEPSAGAGAFVDRLSERGLDSLAFDIEPQAPGITRADWTTTPDINSPHVVIGNPPFGRSGGMARAFMTRAAQDPTCQAVSFILPAIFARASTQRLVDKRLELVAQRHMDRNIFEVAGTPHHVDCVWQLWRRLPEGQLRRDRARVVNHPDLNFTTPDRATVTLRRAGFYAGRLGFDTSAAEVSHVFLAPTVAGLEALIAAEPHLRALVAGTTMVRSVNREQIVQVVSEILAA